MRKTFAKQFLCLLLIVWSALTATAQQSLFVGQSYRMDVSSSVMGLTANVRWSTSGGYLSLSGSGFYRDITPTQYFSGTAIVTCEWDYKLYSGGSYTHVRRQVSITCRENKVSISPTVLTLTEGETGKVSYSHAYSNAYTYYANAYFQSTNPSVCTVDAMGNVRAVGEGFAYINVYSKISGGAPYCQVTVKKLEIPATAIKFDQSKIEIDKGKKMKLKPVFTPTNANSELTWESSDYSVVMVHSSGEIEARYPGAAKITVKTDNGLSASIDVVVNKTKLRVFCDLEPGMFEKGTQITLRASEEVAEIYYTTDGTMPTKASTRYTGPIVLDDNIHLRAIAIHSAYLDSDVLAGTYRVNKVKVVEDPGLSYTSLSAYQAPEIRFTTPIQTGNLFDDITVTLNGEALPFEKQIKHDLLRIIPKADVAGGTLKVTLPENAVAQWNSWMDGNMPTELEWTFANHTMGKITEIDDYYFLFSNGDMCRWDEDGDSMKVVYDNVRHLVDSCYFITQNNDLMGFGNNWEDYDDRPYWHILGDGTKKHRDSPVLIAKDVISASTSDMTKCLLKTDYSLWTWGSNWFSRLGLGLNDDKDYRLSPVRVIGGVLSYDIQGGQLVVKTNTSYLVGWGHSRYLGMSDVVSTPKTVTNTKILEFSTSGNHTVYIAQDNTAWAVGLNGNGECGPRGNTNEVLSPRKIASGIERAFSGKACTYLLRSNGDLSRFGSVHGFEKNDNLQYVTANVSDVRINGYCVAILKKDNSLWLLGHLKDGTFGNAKWMDDVYLEPQKVADDVKEFWLTRNKLYVRLIDDESIWHFGGGVTKLTPMFTDRIGELKEVSLPETMEMRMESKGYAQLSMTPSRAVYDEIKWSSTNPDVATVDEYGIIHSHGEGETEIEALVMADGYEYRSACKLKVAGENVHNEQITLTPDDWVTIYDLRGIHQFAGHYRDWVPRQKGAYVIKFGDRTITCVR